VAVDIATFSDVQAFKQEVRRGVGGHEVVPTLPGVDEVRLPGERSAQLYQERMTHGVSAGRRTAQGSDELADRLGIQRLQ